MENLKIEGDGTVSVGFTADQWQLYTASMDCSKAAEALNLQLQKAVNSGMDRERVRDHMDVVMSRLSGYGAADTEPEVTLLKALERMFESAPRP